MRRNFVAGTAATAAALWAAPKLIGCASEMRVTPEMPIESMGAQDPRLVALSYAIRAPSSHNVQPWAVDLSRAQEIDIYVDRGRLIPEADPPARQTHVSHGGFIELLDITAREMGMRPEVTLFPRGEYSNTVVEDRPVASVRLAKDPTIEKDKLFSQIPKRASNKRVYEADRRIEPKALAELAAVAEKDGWEIKVLDGARERARLAALCRDAMKVEVAGRARNAEMAAWFRFSDKEHEEKRDGVSVANNGVTGLKKWLAETFFLSRDSAADPEGSFASSTVDKTFEQASSASAFAALVSPGNTRADQVKIGRTYVRIQLAATALGIATHPLSQALEEYPEMSKLYAEMKSAVGVPPEHTVQMFFRLGFAKSGIYTPRRLVASLRRRA